MLKRNEKCVSDCHAYIKYMQYRGIKNPET